jgi:hypothetical protein
VSRKKIVHKSYATGVHTSVKIASHVGTWKPVAQLDCILEGLDALRASSSHGGDFCDRPSVASISLRISLSISRRCLKRLYGIASLANECNAVARESGGLRGKSSKMANR